jgi:hypothetical protein
LLQQRLQGFKELGEKLRLVNESAWGRVTALAPVSWA